VDVRTCEHDVMNILMWYSLLWGCCVVKSHEDCMNEGTVYVKLSFDTRVDNETRIVMQTDEYVNMM
jgi:hypothetical protein